MKQALFIGISVFTLLFAIACGGPVIPPLDLGNSNTEGDAPHFTPRYRPMIPVETVALSGGYFVLGENLGTVGENSMPVSAVTLSGFHIGRYPITQEEFYQVMGVNPSRFTLEERPLQAGETNALRRPVETVSWYSAIVFCNRLSVMEGLTPAYRINGSTDPAVWGDVPASRNSAWDAVQIVPGSTGYRLPTEAQWEYAAKGGNNPPAGYTYSGGNNVNEVAWHSGNSNSRTREVGRLQPNVLGIYDMSGNVFEWCWDWWGSYTSGAKTDPTGPSAGSNRVLRGGSWGDSASGTRSVDRDAYDPGHRGNVIGFRLVRP